MKRFYWRFRILLLTFAFGLASVPFFNYLSGSRNQIPVDLPQVQSDAPLYVFPKQTLTEEILLKRRLMSQERDLSAYDFGGKHSDCHWLENAEFRKCVADLVKTRKFLFRHWQEKKRAFIIVTFSSIDWSDDAHIFIEPDEDGSWHIVWIWGNSRSTQFEKDEPGINVMKDLKFRRASEDNYEFDTGTRYLSFTDENGEEANAL